MDAEIAHFCKGGEFGISLDFLILVGFFDMRAFGLEILPRQLPWDFRHQGFRHLLQELAQLAPLPGRQAQRHRPFRGIEVVQIAQVRRHQALDGTPLHRLPEQGSATAADFAQHEQVIVRLVHPQAETGGRFGAFLADPGQRQVEQLGSIGEA